MSEKNESRDWELTCEGCDGDGFVYVERRVGPCQTDIQTFKEECECCEGRGFTIAFEDIPGIEAYVKSRRTAPAEGVIPVREKYEYALARLGLKDSPSLRVIFWDALDALEWEHVTDTYITPLSISPASAQDDAKDELTRGRIEEIAHEVYKAEQFTKDDEVWHNLFWLASFAKAIEKELRRSAPAAGDARVPSINIEAAAKAMAECMDYPWAHMPEQGRATMREHAQTVIRAASQQQGDAEC